jgi:RNA polymerase sigma factor (sigma-70 family)
MPDLSLSTRNPTNPVRDDPAVVVLVTRARGGDQEAWDTLVERYAPLIWSICRRHRLGDDDAADVGQAVWLRLVEQLAKVRDPNALAGWLATTTRRECIRVLRAERRAPDTYRTRRLCRTIRARPQNGSCR